MKWTERIKNAYNSLTARPGIADQERGSMGFPMSTAGIVVDEDASLRMSAVACAVFTICDTISYLTTHLYEIREKNNKVGRYRAYDNALYSLLYSKPNSLQNAVDFKFTMQMNALIHGDGYARIYRDAFMNPVQLELRDPRKVSIRLYGEGPFKQKRFWSDEDGRELFDYEMLHIFGPSKNGLWGIKPLDLMKENLGLALAAEKFGSSFFGKGATVGGALKLKGKIPGKERKDREEWINEQRARFDQMASGVDNMHRVLFLENGSEFERLTFPPEDVQFIQTRKFSIEDVARFYRFPAFMLGAGESKYNNVEHQNQWFYKHTLLPWLVRWEQELDNKLIKENDRKRFYYKFNVQSLLRGDIHTQAETLQILSNMMSVTPDEVREQFDMNPIPGGDKPLIPKNYWHPDEKVN